MTSLRQLTKHPCPKCREPMLYIAGLCQRCKQPFTFAVTKGDTTPREFGQGSNKKRRSKFQLPSKKLSHREAMAFEFSSSGMTVHQVAARMSISVQQAMNARYQACHKLGIKNSSETIVAFAKASPKPAAHSAGAFPASPVGAGVFRKEC